MQTVDDPRRTEIADAVLHLTGTGGIDAVNVRTVADTAGTSVGMVQRLFGTKDALLGFALAHVVDRVGERVHARRSTELDDIGAALTALADALLTGEHRPAWLTFVARAASRPEVAMDLHRYYGEAEREITRLLIAAVAEGRAAAGLHPARCATALLCLLDGLAVHLLVGRIDPALARDIVADQVANYLPGRPELWS